jgi:hypothetical protein
MKFVALALLSAVICSALPAAASDQSRRRPTSAKAISKRASVSKRTSRTKPQSQRAIDDVRATQIQTALIKAGYLSGQPSGHWDAASQAAMEKLQSDNRWQTKLVPDSRALIKLGLGPGPGPGESPVAPSGSVASAQPRALAPDHE